MFSLGVLTSGLWQIIELALKQSFALGSCSIKSYITYHLYCRFLRIYCESPESSPIQICAKVLPFPTEPGPIMSCSSWYKAETWNWISNCYIVRLCKVTSHVHPTWVLINLSSTYLSCCLNIYTLHLFLLIKKQLSEDAAFYCAR